MDLSDDFEPRFADWVDGTMTPAERARFELDLAADLELRRRFDRYRDTVAALRGGALDARAPAGFADAVMDAAGAAGLEAATVPGWRRRGGPLLAAAAVLVAVGLGLWYAAGTPAPAVERRETASAAPGEDAGALADDDRAFRRVADVAGAPEPSDVVGELVELGFRELGESAAASREGDPAPAPAESLAAPTAPSPDRSVGLAAGGRAGPPAAEAEAEVAELPELPAAATPPTEEAKRVRAVTRAESPEAPRDEVLRRAAAALPSGALPSGALPSGALPSGALPSGALPSGALTSGALPEEQPSAQLSALATTPAVSVVLLEVRGGAREAGAVPSFGLWDAAPAGVIVTPLQLEESLRQQLGAERPQRKRAAAPRAPAPGAGVFHLQPGDQVFSVAGSSAALEGFLRDVRKTATATGTSLQLQRAAQDDRAMLAFRAQVPAEEPTEKREEKNARTATMDDSGDRDSILIVVRPAAAAAPGSEASGAEATRRGGR